MMEIEYGKLFVLVLAISSSTILLATHSLTESAGVGIITACLGYAFGNGRLAAKGKEPQPMVKRKPPVGRRRGDTPPKMGD